ncbi:hypothetical protein M885DRAFT_50448 [Pelagophyceae sp. CCMP2097]|nr:hypothetical protein M885DRAFT_50448 [Pelagophyceae sp. CCMP2097]
MGEVVLEVLAAYPPVLDWRDAAGLVLLCAARDATDPSRDAVVEPLPDGGWPTAQFPLEWGLFLGEDSAALGLVVTAPRSHELDLLNQKDGPTSQPRHVYALRASGARLNAPPAPGARFRVRVGASKPQAATFWLAAFERAQLNVFEALPDTVLARRESEVLLVGDFWSYAAEASGVRVLLELEDGRSIELSAKLDGVLGGVTFLTPAVEEAQMCTVTALFDFHETAFRSNSVGLEFRGLPNLKCRTKFIPKSVGGTITLTGGLFKERDALNAFLTSPPIDETGKFEHLKTAAERCALAVRLCGGSAASAAAAAVAAALAEQLVEESVGAITIVSDAVRSTGGTQAVGNAATDVSLCNPLDRTAFSLGPHGIFPWTARHFPWTARHCLS